MATAIAGPAATHTLHAVSEATATVSDVDMTAVVAAVVTAAVKGTVTVIAVVSKFVFVFAASVFLLPEVWATWMRQLVEVIVLVLVWQ